MGGEHGDASQKSTAQIELNTQRVMAASGPTCHVHPRHGAKLKLGRVESTVTRLDGLDLFALLPIPGKQPQNYNAKLPHQA